MKEHRKEVKQQEGCK